MNIREIEYLLAIVQEGNLSKAAAKLYTTQPNISRVVNKIEEKLNISLFNKNKQPWSLTYAGEVFLAHADNIFHTYKLLQQDMKNIENGNKKLLKLGLMPLEERIFLPKILPDFKKKYPYCFLQVSNFQPADIEEALCKDLINLAIIIFSNENPELTYIPVKSYNILLALPLEHKLAKNYTYPQDNKSFPTIDLQLLAQYPFIFLNNQSALKKHSLKICHSHNFKPNIVMEVQRTAAAYNLVKVGYGATFIIEEALETYQKNHIACFKIDTPHAQQTIALAYKKSKKLTVEESFLSKLLKNS